jgi:hypothetical protein
MVGGACAVLRETASVAVPGAIQRSRLYSTAVRKMLDFLVTDIGKLRCPPAGDAASETAAAAGEDSQYVVKKAIGNVIDLAGLTVLHVSPFWVIAIFSDVALGTKTYLRALAEELKRQGVIEKSATIDNIDNLLGALEETSGALAENLDTPPVTVAQLRTSVTRLRQEAGRIDLTRVISSEDVAAVWNELERTASREGRSLLEVSGAVAMMTYTQLVRTGKGAYSSAKVGFDLVNDNIVQHYREALQRIHQRGYYQAVLETYEPYVQGLRLLFESCTETTTEQLLRGKPFRRLWRWLISWFRRKSKKPEAAAAVAHAAADEPHDPSTGETTETAN